MQNNTGDFTFKILNTILGILLSRYSKQYWGFYLQDTQHNAGDFTFKIFNTILGILLSRYAIQYWVFYYQDMQHNTGDLTIKILNIIHNPFCLSFKFVQTIQCKTSVYDI